MRRTSACRKPAERRALDGRRACLGASAREQKSSRNVMGYALFIDHRNALALRSECKYEKEDARALFEDEYESYATQA
jgi:hypothetical protein